MPPTAAPLSAPAPGALASPFAPGAYPSLPGLSLPFKEGFPLSPPLPPSSSSVVPPAPAALPAQAGLSAPNLSAWDQAGEIPQTPMDRAIIGQALTLLGRIQNLPGDEQYIRMLGVNPPFHSGAEALQTILDKGIRVEFGDMGDSPAHAQYVHDRHLIQINARYRGDTSPTTLYAIAAALYHEAGHAKDGDGEASVEEELDCLSLNTMAHRYHAAIDPAYAHAASTSRLLADGVALYPKLFFDLDPYKQALVNRVVAKYGDLPLWSPGHFVPPPGNPLPLAYRVARQVDLNNIARGMMPNSPALSSEPSSPYRFPTVTPLIPPQNLLPLLYQRPQASPAFPPGQQYIGTA